jgi:hypothetical protein
MYVQNPKEQKRLENDYNPKQKKTSKKGAPFFLIYTIYILLGTSTIFCAGQVGYSYKKN